MPEPTTPQDAASRTGRVLLVAAFVILLVAALRNVGDPWEKGLRGGTAATYSHVAVFHTVHYGLGVTLGTPAFIAETDEGLVRNVNWHHPPGYWLYLALWAWPLGNTPPVLRISHLSLFLPGLFALFLFVRRRSGELAAGATSLLFATCPLVAYFGPMVIQDGAVLALGLVTMWCFERHLDAPSRQRWLATAVAFFVTCSLDFTGYWWGPAMFVLAIGRENRWRAVRTVISLFPVSVLAFVVLTIHYGFVFDGPLAFLRELFGTLHSEQQTAVGSPMAERFAAAMDELWFGYHNQVLLGLAGLGVVMAPLAGGPAVRRLTVVGIALLVPGLLNYGLMLHHAVAHAFWSVHGFAGLAALGALVPTSASALIRAGAWRRVVGWLCVLVTAGTAAFGAVRTHTVITATAFEPTNDTPALITKALPWLGGCNTTMTNAPATTQTQFGNTSVFFEIDTADKVRTILAFASANKLRGKVGFVVHPARRDGELLALLDTLGTRQEVDGALVYRFQL